MEKAEDHFGGASGGVGSRFVGADLTKGWKPMKVVLWASTATPNGVSGAPTLATKEKGKAIVEGAAQNLVDFIREFRGMSKGVRVDHRAVRPEMPELPVLD